jgi:hypothetical protein
MGFSDLHRNDFYVALEDEVQEILTQHKAPSARMGPYRQLGNVLDPRGDHLIRLRLAIIAPQVKSKSI